MAWSAIALIDLGEARSLCTRPHRPVPKVEKGSGLTESADREARPEGSQLKLWAVAWLKRGLQSTVCSMYTVPRDSLIQMTHHGVKQITLSPFGQEIVCGNRTVHRWISEEPNFDTGYSVPTVNSVYSSGACRTGPHLAHAKANSILTTIT